MIISGIQVVSTYELDKTIVLTCGPTLKQIQKKIGGILLPINIPADAPPSLPRVSMKLVDAILNVSLDRLQITMVPPAHISSDVAAAVAYVTNRTKTMIADLIPILPLYGWSGVILEFEYPSVNALVTTGATASTPIFDRLLRLDRAGREMAAFQFQFGYVEDGFYVNYTLSGYEKRTIPTIKPQVGVVHLDVTELPIAEVGVGIIMDINNKQKIKTTNPIEDIQTILIKHIDKYKNLGKELNLEGIIT
jgi:hypothetical protein